MDAAALIDLDRYPIHRPGSDACRSLMQRLHERIRDDGCAVLAGFVRPDRLPALVAEADRLAGAAHRSHGRTNPYFSKDDPSLPAAHPVRRFYDRSNAFIPGDNFGRGSPLRAIYACEPFMPFVRTAFEAPAEAFFRYDDPLADVIINMAEAGEGFPWHFDTNNYTVTLAIQNAEEGGAFEYAANVRTPTDENFAAVGAILDGDGTRVRRLVLGPGDLQLFKGRYSLHRVAPLRGGRRRYVGIFSFVEAEGMCGGVERTRQLYGRVLPRHHERAGLRADALRD